MASLSQFYMFTGSQLLCMRNGPMLFHKYILTLSFLELEIDMPQQLLLYSYIAF